MLASMKAKLKAFRKEKPLDLKKGKSKLQPQTLLQRMTTDNM